MAITYSKGADAAALVVKEIERSGRKAMAIQADASDAKAVKARVDRTVATFGQLDVLVNNAGTAIPKTFEETTLEEMDRVIDINIRGVFAATQAALKHMRDGGRIIMIGSAVGERAASPLLVPYTAQREPSRCLVRHCPESLGVEYYGQQCPAGSNRHGFESRNRRVGGTPESRHSTRPPREG